MSEAALVKIQNDCVKLEAEIKMYESSEPMSTACDAIINYITEQHEPFCAGGKEDKPNPWHTSGGSEGGCCSVS